MRLFEQFGQVRREDVHRERRRSVRLCEARAAATIQAHDCSNERAGEAKGVLAGMGLGGGSLSPLFRSRACDSSVMQRKHLLLLHSGRSDPREQAGLGRGQRAHVKEGGERDSEVHVEEAWPTSSGILECLGAGSRRNCVLRNFSERTN